jgi:lipopolysaccharide/colanic/teichoic acid biosynthesis glycosyltransferase
MNTESWVYRFIYYLFLLFLIVAMVPVIFLVSIILYITQGQPVIFCQKRVGLRGKIFTMYKFRTMRVGAEDEQAKYRKQNEANGPVFKIHNDPRFTKMGKFLAHTGLDELPQFFNVLRNDMAIIGPRPLPVAEAKKLTPTQQKRHDIRPGIISPWILEGYHQQPFDSWMKSDIAYITRKSFSYDLALTLRTIKLLAGLLYREIAGIDR